MARAVLKELREPDEGMLLQGGFINHNNIGTRGATAVWQAMIDKALEE